MGFIEDLKVMQEKLDKIPPIPKHIEVTKYMYYEIKKQSTINKFLYGKPKDVNPFGFGEVALWLASDEEQEGWTEEEKKKQFKVVY